MKNLEFVTSTNLRHSQCHGYFNTNLIKMSKSSDKRSGNLSPEQKNELVEFIENHPRLKSGKFSNEFTFKDAQTLWMEITHILNSMPGAKKEWKLWPP